VARGGGGEAVGRGNLGGVERSRRIPASNVRRRLDVVGKKKRQSGRGEGGPVGFYNSALLQGREGGGEVTGHAQDGGRRRRARRGGVAAARDRRPDVEWRGDDIGWGTGGGRKKRATRGRDESGAGLQSSSLRGSNGEMLHRRQRAHGQAEDGVAKRGEANAGPVSGEASGEAARGSDQGGAEAAGRHTWPAYGGDVR
jgi:hypothetical protein